MPINTKQRDLYKKKYIEWLEKLEVKNGVIQIDYDEGLLDLADKILENATISPHITRFELAWLLQNGAYRFREESDKKQDGKFEEIYTAKDLRTIADNFLNKIAKLPHELFFYFKLPFSLPEKIDSIELTSDVFIIKTSKDEIGVGDNPLSALMIGELGKKLDTYCRIRVLGYGDIAETQAITIFKRFLYLTSIQGIITSKPWQRSGDTIYRKGFYKHEFITGDQRMPVTLSSDLSNYISGVRLSEKEFEGYVPPTKPKKTLAESLLTGYATFEEFYQAKFVSGCRTFIRLQKGDDIEEPDHIISAVEWGLDGDANTNETMGFIQTCIALEALLGDKEKRSPRGVTEKLADRCAYLLGKTSAERKKNYDSFVEIYNLRSNLVHGMNSKVTKKDEALIYDAGILLRRLVFKEIWLNV